jgi:hypothetical protein
MSLHWMVEDIVVDEGTFLPGKQLYLESHSAASTPKVLQVYQVYSSAMRQILKHIGIPERRLGPEFRAVHIPPDRHRSERSWRLPEPRGWRKSAAFVFMDDESDSLSMHVYSSRVGKASFSLRGGVQMTDPTGNVPLGVNGEGSLDTAFVFASDPMLSLEVLTGEALVEHVIRNLTEDVGRVDDKESTDVAARIQLEIPELRLSLLEAYTPPDDWAVDLLESSIAGDEGELAKVALELVTPSKGTGYFGVTFSGSLDDGVGETTDIWMVNVDADLSISVIPDPTEVPLPQLAFA